MPGSVANAVATTVLPWNTARGFVREREWLLDENEYVGDGGSQRRDRVATSRKSWRLTQRLTATALAELRTFWEARNGELEAFLFYDVMERRQEGLTPLYDETGVATGAGKYAVRFAEGVWEQDVELGRSGLGLVLQEVG